MRNTMRRAVAALGLLWTVSAAAGPRAVEPASGRNWTVTIQGAPRASAAVRRVSWDYLDAGSDADGPRPAGAAAGVVLMLGMRSNSISSLTNCFWFAVA